MDFSSIKRILQGKIVPVLLFAVTVGTTLLSGVEWVYGSGRQFTLDQLWQGAGYSFAILFVLASHEFGHYFAAIKNKVETSLPYFIPFFSIEGLFLNFGTMGAVIKTKSPIPDTKALMDIGAAGPIAGFVATCGVLYYGFTHLPSVDYILAIHPDYFAQGYGKNSLSLEFGNNILFTVFRHLFAPKDAFIPPMSEIYHYPFLCVGWFGLFITAMNLVPVGQLDGGHIMYALLGEKKQEMIASISMVVLIILGLTGILNEYSSLNLPFGWIGWLFWAGILYFVIKVKHPYIPHYGELSTGRKISGYLSIFIFIVSFTPTPFSIKVF